MWRFIGENWLYIVIFGGGAFEWIADQFDVGMVALSRRRQRKVNRQAEDRALEVRAREAEIEAKMPVKAICLCKHGYNFHDKATGRCAERMDKKSEPGTCLCRRYVGPEPLAQFYAPELTD